MTHQRGRGARFGSFAVLLVLACLGALPALAEDARIKGRIFHLLSDQFGTGQVDVTFECVGAPTCTGTYQAAVRATGCSNTVHRNGAMSLTNVNLAATSFAGTMFAQGAFFHDRFNGDGTCSVTPGTDRDLNNPYVATVGPNGGTITIPNLLIDDNQGTRANFEGTFTTGNAAAPAVGTRIRGSAFAGTSTNSISLTFTCSGEPACTGTYRAESREPNCQLVTTGSDLTMTGLDLSRPGALAGKLLLRNFDWRPIVGCEPPPNATWIDMTFDYTGAWDGNQGTFQFAIPEHSITFNFSGTFTAERQAPPPPFTMTVDSNINATTASASAQVQFRPEDVGRPASVFVFAYAPVGRVRGAPQQAKADGGCVLAQLDSSGQLVAMSASQMQAFFTGVLSSQGSAVSIMNNVPTPSVAGATFYVGYGASGGAMLDEGVFRDAVAVPGTATCPLLPMQTSLWWNPRESGWGLNLNHQGSFLFGTLFTYDATRAPLWLVMSGGQMQPDGRSFRGTLYRTTGPAFNAVPFAPITPANLTEVGTMTVAFADASGATLTYTVDGAQVTKTIQRQVFGPRVANCMPVSGSRSSSRNYQDLWWNAAESGWGINITHQGDTLFATLFTYDATGHNLWLVMSAGRRQADGSYAGELYRTTGPAFNSVPFTPIGAADLTRVGAMALRFADGEHGELTYSYNGAMVTKQITRQVFASPASACN